MKKSGRVLYIAWGMFLCILLLNGTIFATTYGVGGPVEEPTLSITDMSTGSAVCTNSTTVSASIGNDTGVSYWILSDSQSTQPTAGDSNWTATKPTTFTFSSGTNGTKTVYVWTKDASANINSGPVSKTIILDNTGPAGTLSLSFSNITTSGMYVTGAALTDATQGSVYYEFESPTSTTFNRTRTLNDRVHEITSGMSPNTQYTFKYRASDGMKEAYGESSSNYSAWSDTASKYTLASTPSNLALTVSSSGISAAWDGDASSYWIQYSTDNSNFYDPYGMAWRTAKTYSFTQLTNGSSLAHSTLYYLRVKGRNGDSTDTSYCSSASATTLGTGSVVIPTTAPSAAPSTTPSADSTTTPATTPTTTRAESIIPISRVPESEETPPSEPVEETAPEQQFAEEEAIPSEESLEEAIEPSAEQPAETPPYDEMAKASASKATSKTTVTTLEGKVFCYNTEGIDVPFIIAKLYSIIDPKQKVEIDIAGKNMPPEIKPAYIPSAELSSELQTLKEYNDTPVLATLKFRSVFKTDYDVIRFGSAVTMGLSYLDGKVFGTPKGELEELLSDLASLDNAMAQFNAAIQENELSKLIDELTKQLAQKTELEKAKAKSSINKRISEVFTAITKFLKKYKNYVFLTILLLLLAVFVLFIARK